MSKLTHKQIIELIKKAQSGDKQARDMLIEDNLGLVWSIVERFKNRQADFDDLFQAGCLALMNVIKYFDVGSGNKFSTYAVPAIYRSIQRFLRDDAPVRVPRSIKDLSYRIIKEELQDKDPEYINDVLKVNDVDLVVQSLKYLQEGTVRSIYEAIYDDRKSDPIRVVDQIEKDVNSDRWFDYIALKQAIKQLDNRERQIINLRYYKGMTQKQVAEILGVTQVTVSRWEKQAIKKLHTLMSEEEKERETKLGKVI